MSLWHEYEIYLKVIKKSNKPITPVTFKKYKECDINAKDICNKVAKNNNPEALCILIEQIKHIESTIKTGEIDIDKHLPRSIKSTKSILSRKYGNISKLINKEKENYIPPKAGKIQIPQHLVGLDRHIAYLEIFIQKEPDPKLKEIYTQMLIKARQKNVQQNPINEQLKRVFAEFNSSIITSNYADSSQPDNLNVKDYLTDIFSNDYSGIFNEEILAFESLKEMLELYKDTAIKEIQDRKYGIPENYMIIVEPDILRKKFLEFRLTEEHNSFYAHITTVLGNSISHLDLYQEHDNDWLFLAQVYILCIIADMVKSRPEVNKRSIKIIECPAKKNKSITRNTTIIRRYPKTKSKLVSVKKIKSGQDFKQPQKIPVYVPWHFRNIGNRQVSNRARENALASAGITSIPKGLTFVNEYWRGLKAGEEPPEIIVKSFLADSLINSLNSIL